MRIVVNYIPHVTAIMGLQETEMTIGEFATYDEAYDAAILWASRQLPHESMKSFTIEKIYYNAALSEYSH